MEYVETVVVGAGQAGLSTSYYLKQAGNEHVVLEKSDGPVNNWRNGTWDSFTLVTPNWAFRIPGLELKNEDRNGFLPRRKIIETFESYIRDFQLPVKFNTELISVEKMDKDDYLLQTKNKTYRSKNVVIATGLYQHPKFPAFASRFSPDVLQIHSSKYRNPQSLPPGNILVAGSGQSGCQIAIELNNAGRKVFLCAGKAGRAPRRYRGTDIIERLEKVHFFDLTLDNLPPGMGKFDGIPHLSGANGGFTINLHELSRNGVTLLGRIKDVKNEKAIIAPDLHKTLEMVDQFELNLTTMIDEFIRANQIDAPEEKITKLKDGFNQPIIEELDLKKENISTIIWACGYKFDYSFIKLPVQDPDGFPIQKGGKTDYPGLYFVGMPWMPSEKTGFLVGVAEAAERIANDIVKQREMV
jgi:putative flavoprotein involved in K+ transport